MEQELINASQQDDLELVKELLAAGANVHAQDDISLRWASYHDHFEVVKALLVAGANVHTGDDHPLLMASYYGHLEVVKLLLSAGANVHAKDDISLRRASENGHTHIVKLLLFYYPKGNCIKQRFPELFGTWTRQHTALRRFQLHILDVLWRPGGRICNKNYFEMRKKEARRRLPIELKSELIQMWGIPIGIDPRPIFAKGGPHYHELADWASKVFSHL